LAALKAAEATPDNPGVGPAVCEGTSELVHNDANLPRKYSVQIGAFLDASNALRLAGDFKAKGYKPCLMKASDRQGRRWTVVRMGEFENVSSASMYAHSITGREQVVALVRPSDSF
jgi:cell division septation protein DedD